MYYIEKDNKIVLADTDRIKLEKTVTFMPDLKDLPILEGELVQGWDSNWYHSESDIPAKPILKQIQELEATITERNRREATIDMLNGLTTSFAIDKIKTVNAQIEELRKQQ